MRPCDSLAWPVENPACQRDALFEKLSTHSPVDLVDTSLRSSSMTSTVVTDRVTSDLDLCSLDHLSDAGLCYSSRSEDSVEGVFTGIESFDALMLDKLPRLKLMQSSMGLVRQVSFDVPEAPHREGAEDKAFERTCETVEKTKLSFDLRKVISSFRRDKRAQSSSRNKEETTEEIPSVACTDHNKKALNEQKNTIAIATMKNQTERREDMVDFMFMVPS